MGNNNSNSNKKPSPQRRATIDIHTMKRNQHMFKQSDNNETKEFHSPKKRMSWSIGKSKFKDINMLSPQPRLNRDNNNSSTTDTEKKNNKSSNSNNSRDRGKIKISSYVAVNDGLQTPQRNHFNNKKKNNTQNNFGATTNNGFLSPTKTRQSIMSSTSLNAKLFSPSNNKSGKSISTASPGGRYIQQRQTIKNTKPHQTVNNHTKQHQTTPLKNKKSSLEVSEIVVASRFRLIKKLGKGSFGVAYESFDLLTNKCIAIKLERKREGRHSSSAMNTREITILEKLESCHRVPSLIWHGQYKQYRVIALELQGLNLCDLYDLCHRKFTLSTAIYIFIECLYCMEDIHSRGIVHRDIKPQNFILSKNLLNNNKIFVIDFGLSSWFLNCVGNHISYNDECSPVGTARYASLNNHRGIHQTRRDDLESIGYMIIFFLKGELPWQGLREPGRVKKWKKIEQKKASVPSSILTHGLPHEFCYYLDYIKKLKYNQKPDYHKLIKVFKKLYINTNFNNDDDFNDNTSNVKTQDIIDDIDNYKISDHIIPDWIPIWKKKYQKQ